MRAASANQRRPYGTGSLHIHILADGSEAWYGRWWDGSKRVKRKLGPKRRHSSQRGLGRLEAEAELRRMMARERQPPAAAELPLGLVAEHMLLNLELRGRKATTLAGYRSLLRNHLLADLGELPIGAIGSAQVEELAARMLREGKSASTRANALKLLSQVFSFAQRREWCRENPCRKVGYPRVETSTDIRFLTPRDLDALLGAVDCSREPFGALDRAIFLTAALTGLRQGELLALRWRDVDWRAQKIRVRRSYVRGHWSTPKSHTGRRSVPLATRVAAELEGLRSRSPFTDPDDLAFAHPLTGGVLSHNSLVKRFKAALRAAGVREVRFHDLRHTFATRIAGAGIPLRTLQQWMGHQDFRTTLIYADYEPREEESRMVDSAFGSPQTLVA